jgi:hypothetical protein
MSNDAPFVLDTMHAALFHDRVYSLLQTSVPLLCEHPMARHNERIAAATAALTEAIAGLYLVAGEVLMDMEDAEAEQTKGNPT